MDSLFVKRRLIYDLSIGIPASLAIASITCAAICFCYLAFWSDDGWFHPEILGSACYIWLRPGSESLIDMLRKVFDWKAFDPNVTWLRPLNDFFEVVDAIVRPYIVLLFGQQLSLNVSSALSAVAASAAVWLVTTNTCVTNPAICLLQGFPFGIRQKTKSCLFRCPKASRAK